eukprot:355445_1
MLKFISYVPTLHSSEVLVLIALIYVLVFYKTYSACRIMFKRVIWKPFPCETEGREWRKQSVVKKLGKRKTKLQNRARSFSIRIRDSAFPSNRTDGVRNIFEKRNGPSVVEGPPFVLSRLEKSICRDLSNEGQMLVQALRALGVFGAA